MIRRGVITLAFGPEKYIEVAKNLALSVRRNWPNVPISIITDRPAEELTPLFDSVIALDKSFHGTLYHKLSLDTYTPYSETLFLDSDCLVVRNMDFAWDYFAETDFGVIGEMKESGPWFGTDIARLRAVCNIPGPMAQFNSGLVYWKSNGVSTAVFTGARAMWDRYDEIGLGIFRANLPKADEPLLSLGMAAAGVQVSVDSGLLMNTPIGLKGRMSLDALGGSCSFVKNNRAVQPAAPHFCGYFRDGGYYRREALRLRLWRAGRAPEKLVRAATWVLFLPLVALDHSVTWGALRRVKRGMDRILQARPRREATS
jgi:hypothetical protein